ncbi:MAG: RING finger domain-containing protein [Culicoidibacterales bacterium]
MASQHKLKKIKEIDINCGICMEVLVEPTSLNSCGHTYCLECITKYWHSTREADFACPVCKKVTHICSIADFQGNNIITQLIESLKPKGYKKRKEDYFEQKKMYNLLRKYIGGNRFQSILVHMEEYFNASETSSCTLLELIRAMKMEFPDTKSMTIEVKIILSSVLNARMLCIHGNNLFKCDPRNVSTYIQDNIEHMTAADVAELVKPFAGLNYEIEPGKSPLKTLLRDYQEVHLEKIYNYLLKQYGEELESPEESDEQPDYRPEISVQHMPLHLARSLPY